MRPWLGDLIFLVRLEGGAADGPDDAAVFLLGLVELERLSCLWIDEEHLLVTDSALVGRGMTLPEIILDATLIPSFSSSFPCSLSDAVARVELLPDHPFNIKIIPI